jgi:hypothetical protein
MKQLPNSAAAASAITLLGQYLDEERQRSRAGLEAFLDWLRSQGRHELPEFIVKNASVADSLCGLMEHHR